MACPNWAYPGVARTVTLSGFPLMQRGFNGEYDLVFDEASAQAAPEPEAPSGSTKTPLMTRMWGALKGSGEQATWPPPRGEWRRRATHTLGLIAIAPSSLSYDVRGSQWVFRPGNIRSEPTTEQTPVGAAFVEVDGITIEITGAGESRSLIGMAAFPAPQWPLRMYQVGAAGSVDLARGMAYPSLLNSPHLRMLETTDGERISALHVRRKGARLTVVYSHGNGEDVAILLDYVEALSVAANVNVLCYEYVGYGLSRLEGKAPSESGCYRSIDAAWRYLTVDEATRPSEIVLYGRSVGSGPTSDLASQERARDSIAGVVLESPLSSGARILLGKVGALVRPLDIFTNVNKIGRVMRPVLIMHGEEDQVVPFSHGQELYGQLSYVCPGTLERYPPMWCPNRGHNDMPQRQCLERVAKFVEFLSSEK